MTIEMEIGSIMKRCVDVSPNIQKVYTDRMPENFEVPSLYFPPPITIGEQFTSHSYARTHTLQVKLFDVNDTTAFYSAERIADSIRKSRYVVPLVNEDGSLHGRKLILSEAEVRQIGSGELLMGVFQITLSWTSYHNYEFPTYEKIMKVYGRFLDKDETI